MQLKSTVPTLWRLFSRVKDIKMKTVQTQATADTSNGPCWCRIKVFGTDTTLMLLCTINPFNGASFCIGLNDTIIHRIILQQGWVLIKQNIRNYHLPYFIMLLDLALVEHELTTLDYILAKLKVNLLEAQTNIKTYSDQQYIHIHFIWVTWCR